MPRAEAVRKKKRKNIAVQEEHLIALEIVTPLYSSLQIFQTSTIWSLVSAAYCCIVFAARERTSTLLGERAQTKP